MHAVANSVLLVLCSFAGLAPAQTPALLPSALTGRWTFMGPSGVFTDNIAIRFDGTGAPGPVTGKITAGGVTCGARDEPLTGTWDGTELRFEAKVHANVNTTRSGGDCSAPAKYVLTRKPGQAAFEGHVSRGASTSQVQLTP